MENSIDSDKANRWLTLGANLGVLLGILFLAYEINLSRTVALAEIYQGRAHSRSEANLQIALSSGKFAEADQKFRALLEQHTIPDAVAALTSEEFYLLQNWHISAMVRFDNVAYQYELGLIPDAYMESNQRTLRRLIPIWREFGFQIPDTSREYFESLVPEEN